MIMIAGCAAFSPILNAPKSLSNMKHSFPARHFRTTKFKLLHCSVSDSVENSDTSLNKDGLNRIQIKGMATNDGGAKIDLGVTSLEVANTNVETSMIFAESIAACTELALIASLAEKTYDLAEAIQNFVEACCELKTAIEDAIKATMACALSLALFLAAESLVSAFEQPGLPTSAAWMLRIVIPMVLLLPPVYASVLASTSFVLEQVPLLCHARSLSQISMVLTINRRLLLRHANVSRKGTPLDALHPGLDSCSTHPQRTTTPTPCGRRLWQSRPDGHNRRARAQQS